MSVLTYYPALDGSIRYYTGAGTWASIRAEVTGTDVYSAGDPQSGVYSDAALPLIIRGFLTFDTSNLDAGVTITSARLRLYGTSITGTVGSVCLVASTPASSTSLATADYDQLGATELASNRIAVSSWNTAGYNDFTLNAAGIAAISTSGYTKLGLIHSSDLDNSSPASGAAVNYSASEHAGTSQDPILEITTLTPPPRQALGSEVTIFASNGVGGTFGAHYAFAGTARLADGTLFCVATKGDQHSSRNTTLVYKTSTDDGLTWSAESTIIDERSDGFDTGWRDPYVTVLASGRIALTAGRPRTVSAVNTARPPYLYSDDDGATWSTPVYLTGAECGTYVGDGTNHGFTYGSDIIELANGDILLVSYGSHADTPAALYDISVSKSTDDGATWTFLSHPALGSTYSCNAVEPQAELLSNGDIFMTFHTEDGLPTDFYTTRSTDSGATWSTPVKVNSGNSFNRQGLTVFSDDSILISFNRWSDTACAYIASYDGGTWSDEVTIAADPVGGASLDHPLWVMSTSLSGAGDSQSVGFTYTSENTAQTISSAFWRQFGAWHIDLVPATETDSAQVLSLTQSAGGVGQMLLTRVG